MTNSQLATLVTTQSQTADDGGTEVVLGAPLKFDTSNIEEMAKLY